MIRHSLKMIWAERKSNSWILIELIIVFSILWFCSGFIYETTKQLIEPMGIDIRHTYQLRFNFRKDVDPKDYPGDYDYVKDGMTIFDRLKKYPEIKNVCFSENRSTPYSGSYSSYSINKDSIDYYVVDKPVSSEYFDVFKIKFQAGKVFDSNEATAKDQVVASPDKDNKFFKEDIVHLKEIIKQEMDPTKSPPKEKPKTKEEWASYMIDVPIQVTGVVNKIKRSEYDRYERIIFKPLTVNNFDPRGKDICIRVKSEADKQFIQNFQKNMSEQLKVGPFELASIIPFSQKRAEYIRDCGYKEKEETVSVIVLFLLINVFLGIVGTFRFRANARRGEIGLRAAVGSSKKKIQYLLLTETFLMLFFASIPAIIIALNIHLAGVLPKLGVSFLESYKNPNEIISNASMLGFYLITYLITFVMMLIIMWLGTWYPAKKASEIQPAEALHYE